ncbi:MAG: thiamine pyrophosphate-dependent enzyme [Candidatus Eisenbacteria bacterium]
MARTPRPAAAPAPMINDERGARFASFVAEHLPHLLARARGAWDGALPVNSWNAESEVDAFARRLSDRMLAPTSDEIAAGFDSSLEATPRVSVAERLRHFEQQARDAIQGFVRREQLRSTFTREERREVLRGMLLTRALDNQLKTFFTGGAVRWGGRSFQGKGFRSLGQEAIYAAALRLRRGESFRASDGRWQGDVIAPMIRDLGAVLAMRPDAAMVRMVLNAQMGKAGPPMEGRDLHVGDWGAGILPATAPLGISALTAVGLAFAFAREGTGRLAVTLGGEGATSLGEWHEAINLAATRRLPVIFCVQNNQTALSTPVLEQSAARRFADKGSGYGIPAISLDGTDADAIAAAFAWAAERARAGLGPTLLELIAMRICGHAHHDDMLYLGREPSVSWDYPELVAGGYADAEAFAYWAARDPLRTYAVRLERDGVASREEVQTWKEECESIVAREAQAVIDAEWPIPRNQGVLVDDPPQQFRDPVDSSELTLRALAVEEAPPFDPKGATFLEAIMLAQADALERDSRAFIFGQDVGGRYGNAFLLLRPLLERFPDRIVNSTLAEGGILGVCVGAALAGQRPIGEMQFNDFVATGFNQLVNNAAKLRYRWGASVPMVVRMPWGGLRSAGPFHSQNTEAWFYRTPGLKLVCPSTPHDARALFAAAMADPDPVLFYEHIALYRDPKIKQLLSEAPPLPLPLGRAALRRDGSDLAIVSYGAFVHLALRIAENLAREGIEVAVLDLRSLVPLDLEAVRSLVRRTGRLLVLHEDSVTGGIGESLAAKVQESVFSWLDAPIRVIGALDTPVPYSPPLEEAFLPSEAFVLDSARRLARF